MHFFKQRYFLIFTISCNNNFGCFVEYSLPIFLFVFHMRFYISVPLFHFIHFSGHLFAIRSSCSNRLQQSFADDDEACKVFCHFLIFGRFLGFMSANIKEYYYNINLLNVKEIVKKSIKKGWSVPVILPLNNNYFIHIQHQHSIWLYLSQVLSDAV